MSGTEKDNVNITEPVRQWASTSTLGVDHISSYTKDILEKPKYFTKVTDENQEREPLYTRAQMLQMFQRGYEANSYGPYQRLGKMAVNDLESFPYDSWGSLRNAASFLKKRFGKLFSIRKLSGHGELGDIEVIRKS